MKNLNLEIRAYRASDVHLLSSIWYESSLQAHPFLGKARLQTQKALIESQYLPNSETWVAVAGAKPVGFISLLDTFVGGMFITPQSQRQGIGRALIMHALKLSGEITLEVYTENKNAVAFYQRLGFEEVSRRSKDDEGLPFENIQMRLLQ